METISNIELISKADTRRIFAVDVGDIPADKIKEYIEAIQYEIRQKKLDILNDKSTNQTVPITTPIVTTPGTSASAAEYALNPIGKSNV